MILTKLKLRNFKRFKEDTTFELGINNINNNIILIEALNWVGKTSFLQAVKWAFFWLEASEFKKYLNYDAKDDNDFSISIELEYKDNNFQDCKIIRKYFSTSFDLKPKEVLEFYIDNNLQNFTIEEWNNYLNKTFPKEISNFFFFDGEKIQYLINPNDPKKVKSAIEKVLGIEIIRNLRDDLLDLRNEIFKKINNDGLDKKIQIKKMQLEDYENKRIKLKSDLSTMEDSIRDKEESKKEILDKIEILAKSWLTKEKLDEKNKKEQKVEELIKELSVINETIEAFKSNHLDTFLLMDFLDSLESRIQKEHEANGNISYVSDNQVNAVIHELFIPTCILWWEEFDASKVGIIKEKIKKALNWNIASTINTNKILDLNNKEEININIAIDRIKKSHDINLLELLNKKEVLVNDISLLKNEIRDIDRQTETNSQWIEDINILYVELEKVSTDLQKLNTELSIQTKNAESVDNEIKKIQKEIEIHLSRATLLDNDKKYFDMLSKISNIFELYVDKLIVKRKNELESKTLEMFHMLSSQKIYTKIEITNDYEVKLLDTNGNYQLNLSAWQVQILMTSLLWALEKLSNFQLPVIIDTPLARLDPIHRKNMLEKYFHNAGWQVIILSQPSEITKEDKDNILFSQHLRDNSYMSMTFNEDKLQTEILIKTIS